jgi:hypothetical protein
MSDSSTSTEPVAADSESPPSEVSSLSSKGDQDDKSRAKVLVVGLLVGLGIGLGIGMGIGNSARKRIDRWARY